MQPDSWIVVEPQIWGFLVDAGIVSLLRQSGWRLVPDEEVSIDDDASISAVIRRPGLVGDKARRRVGKSTLTLGASLIPAHIRMGLELPDARPGDDTHLARLVATIGQTLDDDAIADALSLFPPVDRDCSTPVASNLAAVGALFLPSGAPVDEMSDLGGSDVGGRIKPEDRAGVVTVDGFGTSVWRALSDGSETICIGSSPLAALGLTHDAPTRSDISAALQGVAKAHVNHRDRTRRALATEILFNSVSVDDQGALVALIDAGLRASVRPRRPSVSIVITNYNYLSYVGAAIESSQLQTVPALEIVVVDDGSTDGSAQAIARMPGIIPVLQANGGQAAAFNAGFARTSGDIVIFLDADDCLLPQAVERIGLSDQTGASRLFFRLETIDRHGRVTGLYSPGTPTVPAATGMLAGAVAAQGIFPFVPTSGNAFPRWVLDRLLPMPEADWTICADLWLVLAAAAIGEAREIAELLGQYRVHGKNAHFHDLGSEPYARIAHLKRRTTAWNGLPSCLPSDIPFNVAQALTIGLHRCQMMAAARAGWHHTVRHIPKALRIAVAARNLPAMVRILHAALPLRLAITLGSDRLDDFAQRHPANLLDRAGPAGWPRLVPGELTDLSTLSSGSSVLGRGWSVPEGNGARLFGRAGSIAFRLPELGRNWRVRIGFEVDGTDPIREVVVSLNGHIIDEVDLHHAGALDLRLPSEFLLRWEEVVGPVPPKATYHWPGVYWNGAEPAACLTLRVKAADAGRLRVLDLKADVLTTTRAHAPPIPVGQYLRITKGSADFLGMDCLQSGWDWPDERGVRMSGASGFLAFSLARDGAHAVTFVFRAAEDGTTGVPPADRVMVSLNGVMVVSNPSPDGLQVTVEIPERAALPDGRIRVALIAFADPVTGRWPHLILIGLRLDRLSGAETGGWQGRMLLPNAKCPAGPHVAAVTDGVRGLLVDGETARMTEKAVKLPLILPENHGEARLHLSVSTSSPVLAMFSLGGLRCQALVCAEQTITLKVPSDLPPDPVLEIEIADPEYDFIMHSICLALVMPPSACDTKTPAPGWEEHSDGLGPSELYQLAAENADWHRPTDDALWLATHRAVLILPPLPAGTEALLVSLLPISAAGQGMRIKHGCSAVETQGPGPQTLRLPLVATAPDVGLVITSNLLVASQSVDAGDAGMLGGAVLRVLPELCAARKGGVSHLNGSAQSHTRPLSPDRAPHDKEHP